MKNCTKCKYARWLRDYKGRLYPSGEGFCKFPYKIPDITEYKGCIIKTPVPLNCYINKHEELKYHCACYEE